MTDEKTTIQVFLKKEDLLIIEDLINREAYSYILASKKLDLVGKEKQSQNLLSIGGAWLELNKKIKELVEERNN